MNIGSVEVRQYQIPLSPPLTDSTHGEIMCFTVITVQIRCDTGEEGLGYTYTVGKTGGASIRMLIEQDLAPFLTGKDPRRIEHLWEEMWWRLHYVGRGGIASFAIAAVDIALWDLKGHLTGEPLWCLLGGHSNRVRVYAGGIDLHLPLEELCAQTRRNLDQGFRAVKMKVGRDRLFEDVERVAAVRDLIGSEVSLMVDANMRWTVEEAIQASHALAEYDVHWLEEPTIPDDVEGHARIVREGDLPIATGENLHTIYEFQRMISCAGVSFPEPDVSNIGGVTSWTKVAHLAEAFNLPVTSHGVHDIHVHLLSAVPNASFLEVHGFGLEEFIRHPLEVEEGVTVPPDRPGHGIAFDWDALKSHQIC